MRQTTIDKIETLILDGVPLRDALVSVGVPNSYMKRVATFDYNRLMRLARGVKAAKKGKTLREVCRLARIDEARIAVLYPSLRELCLGVKKGNSLSRLANICEILVRAEGYSLQQIAHDMGETVYMVNKAWARYHGRGEDNQYGLKSKV